MSAFVTPAIQAFFKEYEQGANTFDVELNRRERAEAWLAASPGGVAVAYNDEQFPAKLHHRHQQLLAMGYQSAVLTSLEEQRLDAHYSLVKTAWRQFYQKAGQSKQVDITVDYIVRLDEMGIKIICSIAHEDEAALLQAKGIIER